MNSLDEIKNTLAQKENVIDNMSSTAEANKGFKSNGRKYKRVFKRHERKSVAVDNFGGKYFADDKDDYTKSLSITLPKSMVEIIDKKRKKDGITRSRFIRKIIEFSLDIEQY